MSSGTAGPKNTFEDKFKSFAGHLHIHENHAAEAIGKVIDDESVKKILGELKEFVETFFAEIESLRVQTVVLNSPTGTISQTISSAAGEPKFLDTTGTVTATYYTIIKIGGDTQNVFPEKVDQTIFDRHNQLVDQMWKARTDTIVKIIDGITGALKIGTFL